MTRKQKILKPARITMDGFSAKSTEGKDIPQVVTRRYYLGRLGTPGSSEVVDYINIKRISGTETVGEFQVLVKEEGDGEKGGGIFGDLVDQYARENMGQEFYKYTGYNESLDLDFYKMGYDCLDWVWSRYLQAIGYTDNPAPSDAQREARSKNIEKAQEATRQKRKHLRNHFLERK